MAVVEYKHHVYLGDHRRHIPGFVSDPDHWHNPANHSFVGWVPENPDYYVPWTTLKVLTKEDFVQRCLVIHAQTPIMVPTPGAEGPSGGMQALTTEAEVRAHAEAWYDAFVARNSA
jgi:hypothetical protein